MSEILEIKTSIQIQKPTTVVFNSIVNPDQMNQYFISKSNGMMLEGATLNWNFPEFEMNVPIRVGTIKQDEYVSYYWNAEDGTETFVEMNLIAKGENDTHIIITEKSMPNREAGIKWLKSNTEGWANFLACLKAYLEYGINLRKGAFDFMRK